MKLVSRHQSVRPGKLEEERLPFVFDEIGAFGEDPRGQLDHRGPLQLRGKRLVAEELGLAVKPRGLVELLLVEEQALTY